MAASSAAFLELKQLLSSLPQSCSTMLRFWSFVPKQLISSSLISCRCFLLHLLQSQLPQLIRLKLLHLSFAQWAESEMRHAFRSTCRCRRLAEVVDWFSSWLLSWCCCWFRLRFCCWCCSRPYLFYKCFSLESLRCSRNVSNLFHLLGSIRY